MRKKIIIPGELHHVFQRSHDRGLLFYTAADVLTYYTICMLEAGRHDVRLLGLCPMRDHVHGLVIPGTAAALASFEAETNKKYAREFNMDAGLSGPVFEHSYDCAVRRDLKKSRSSIIYLYNNPVEKHLCKTAIEARWNFLAYGFRENPFSKPLVIREASYRMRSSISEIRYMRKTGKHLNQSMLRRLFSGLSCVERNQLTDFIVNTFNSIDYHTLFSYWKSPEEMILATNSTTGSEFGIREKVNKSLSDAVYSDISSFLENRMGFQRAKDVLALPEKDKRRIAKMISYSVRVNEYQICKFLHLW